MKYIVRVCIVSGLCLAVLGAEAVVGVRRLEKPKKQKQTIELAVCTCCGKKFPRESLTNSFCSRCWCKEHRKMKTNGVCKWCKSAEKMKNGTAKCEICGKTSKEALLYFSGWSSQHFCIDHWCPKHKIQLVLQDSASSEYSCPRCIDEQETERKQEELENAKQNVKAAEVELELAFAAWSAALPEKHCDVHKWKAEYAPRFGGDYYTEDAKTKYARNYMKALELQEKGLLKCTCADHQAYYLRCIGRCKEAKKKLEDAEKKVEELKNKGEQK